MVMALFGQDCSWTPSAGGSPIAAKVLMNEPTDKVNVAIRSGKALYTVSNWETEISQPFFEYKGGDLIGLEDSVAHAGIESVQITSVINGVNVLNTYYVKEIVDKYDGFNKKAILQPA